MSDSLQCGERLELASRLAVPGLRSVGRKMPRSGPAFRKIVRRGELARQEAVLQRAVAERADPFRRAAGENFVLDGPDQQVVWELIGDGPSDRQKFVQVTDTEIAHRQESDLTLISEFLHRGPGFVAGHGSAGPVDLVEVNVIRPQIGQASFASGDQIVGRGVFEIEFRRDHRTVPYAGETPAEHLFRESAAVHFGRVEKVDPHVQGRADRVDRILFVLRPPCGITRQGPAAHGNGRDFDVGIGQRCVFHGVSSKNKGDRRIYWGIYASFIREHHPKPPSVCDCPFYALGSMPLSFRMLDFPAWKSGVN